MMAADGVGHRAHCTSRGAGYNRRFVSHVMLHSMSTTPVATAADANATSTPPRWQRVSSTSNAASRGIRNVDYNRRPCSYNAHDVQRRPPPSSVRVPAADAVIAAVGEQLDRRARPLRRDSADGADVLSLALRDRDA